ncbi:MAG: acyltransferase, partial [Actinobacteria bacterium]|nr:acyltransferase [Actinomycetota bacterium]NIT94463.1 acyltransferase [Actinomycetota bacterium]NIU64706.1 acyltransferase [Actinomycetota bacterium]NIW26501.1 acyltransferase [Actinomycetota bacterium]NIX49448.1 acyltransferase [Actinomycetota bacterium]
AFLRLTGWRIEGKPPEAPQFVLIGAPHTTNWDMVYLLAVAWALQIDVSWVGKQEIFRRPFGGIMRRLGGIPVRRDRSQSMVEQMAAAFAATDRLALVLAPEGTRSAAEYWRSGFYHIGRTAGVPIATGFVDYERKVAGFGPVITLSEDIGADMDRLREFYGPIVGRRPGNQGPIRLREEAG